MAIKYPEDRKRFISDLRAAGLPAGRASSPELAELLGFSVSHIKNLFYGTNRYGSTTKDKLDALIAAKANGPEPVEQFEVDLPEDREPVRAKFPTGAQKFFYIPGFDGTATVVGEIAQFRSETEAARYVEFLNKEGG